MSAAIVRIEGEIIDHQQALEKLVAFLTRQSKPHLLVVTALPGLSQAIRNEIDKTHEKAYSQASIEDIFEKLASLVFSPSGADKESGNNEMSPRKEEFRRQCLRLTGLLRGIHLTGDYSVALKDQVMSFGELLTAWLVAARLEQILTKVVSHEFRGQAGMFPETGKPLVAVLTPEELGLRVTADYGNATIISLDHPEAIASAAGEVVVVPGSYGIAPYGKIARTGRSAADYTAAFLAGALGAEQLILWNLRMEFTSVDPEIVPQAGILRHLTYAEASELSYFDHFDFHPRTVEPLQANNIPIHILSASTLDYQPETVISSEEHPSATVVKSIAGTDDLSVLQLNGPGVGLKPGILARITGKLAEEGINIKSVITSQVSINILLGRKEGAVAQRIAGELGFTAVSEITLLDEVTLVAIVGHGMQNHYGISATLFKAVANHQINVILSGSGASDLVSYLVIAEKDKSKCVKAVYQAFIES